MKLLLVVAISLLLASCPFVYASADPRCCGEPVRDSRGKIVRSKKAVAEFRSWHACPSTKLYTGPCPDYDIDHPIPLGVGGCDAPYNMIWLKNSIKSCPGTECKDRWELDAFRCPGVVPR